MMNPRFQSFLYRFFRSPKGHSLLQQEKVIIDQALEQVFGLYLVQLGIVSSDDLLANSRANCKVMIDTHWHRFHGARFVAADFDYLPLKSDSVDVVVLPHTLEAVTDPYHILRQVDDVLIAEGNVLITGFNPAGCRIMRNLFGEHRRYFKKANLVRAHRIIDWLSVLGYDIEMVSYTSPSCLMKSDSSEKRWKWVEAFERLLEKMGLNFGNTYCILAKKRVSSPTPVGLNWRISNWLAVNKGRSVVSNRSHQTHHNRVEKDS
ncbi:class I SAM-dependent methyltransferase [Hydrogenovibrio crunogenus]|uniref:Class I SAM-dependent methyltransferase n=1 Tax=Hydrogenovibrio crunogenus TaxID=39765 RepID=A0A4P7NZB9_9GAMM|nr:methyltransferase domain-containing protein [Hydrogenovibrio crunogenus]QBZ82949.1 class I SAM-dependent methyltransferase [Hydrogenovibrio crunogenus]RUM92132.1 MAG: hypothetical protein DSZ27_04370 [Thiomicrospira sp.]